MKKKTAQATEFIQGLHDFILRHPQFRGIPVRKTESQIQTRIRPIIIEYLQNYYREKGFKDSVAKANRSFYWEGHEGRYGKERSSLFGARSYPDFIITDPYLIAIEYKKSASGSTIKQIIGQLIMHTLCDAFDYVYFLFHDESQNKRIAASSGFEAESLIIERMWRDFNVFIGIV